MNNLDIKGLQERIEALKDKQKQSFDKLSIALSKSNVSELLPIYSDIKMMQLMFENGNIDEKQIENIKAKYGTETNK
jgi:DNA-binding ferritin-like protein (Dps family)